MRSPALFLAALLLSFAAAIKASGARVD